MAAAIAANPDIPVPAAAMSVHPDPSPEFGATAMTVTVGAGWAELFVCAIAGVTPVEVDWGPAIASEDALVRAVTVTVVVTVAVALGTTVVPAVDVAFPAVAVGESTAGIVG